MKRKVPLEEEEEEKRVEEEEEEDNEEVGRGGGGGEEGTGKDLCRLSPTTPRLSSFIVYALI